MTFKEYNCILSIIHRLKISVLVELVRHGKHILVRDCSVDWLCGKKDIQVVNKIHF